LHICKPATELGLARVAVDDDPIEQLPVLFHGFDRTGVRELGHDPLRDDLRGLAIVDRRHERRPELGQELLLGLRGAQVLFQPLALADVAYQALPSAVREDLRADLGEHVAAVLPAQRPLEDHRLAPDQLLPHLHQPIDVLGQDHVGDRPCQDLLARVAEHPAAGAVDVGVPAGEIGDEHAVGSLLEEGPGPRAAGFEVLVGPVQGDRGATEHEQADHGHRGRQHRNHRSKCLTADGPQRKRDDDTDDDRDEDRRKHEASKLLPARSSRGGDAHQPRRRAFEQETDRDQQQGDGGRQRRADERDAGHPMVQLRAKDESQQGRQRGEPRRQREPLRWTHPGAGADIEEQQRGRQEREGQRGRRRRPSRIGLDTGQEESIDGQVGSQRVLRERRDPQDEHQEGRQQR
jgi:hypothetical protein